MTAEESISVLQSRINELEKELAGWKSAVSDLRRECADNQVVIEAYRQWIRELIAEVEQAKENA